MRMFTFLAFALLISFRCAPQQKELINNSSSIVICDSVFTGGIEGPAFDANGNLYVVNYKKEGVIGILRNGKDAFEEFVDLPNGSVGNGIRFDAKGDMFIADYVNNNILWIEKGTKHIEVFAHNDSINQPNDLTIHRNGFGFASDPNWALGTGNLLKFQKGKIEIVESNMGTTNGVELSPDGKVLYVNESVQTCIWRYDVDSEGSLSNKQKLVQFEGFGMDGMRCDTKGNLFLARYGAGKIIKISPHGEVVKEYLLNGEKPTNVTFKQGNDQEIFVTMQEKRWVEKIKLP